MVTTRHGGRGGTTVEVVGGRQLRASLKAAGDDLSDLKDAHAEAANVVATTGRVTAPRRTGRLGSTVRGTGTKTQSVIRAGYAAVPYAGVVHWGWPAHNIKAQPWLADAAASTEPRWFPVFVAEVQRILDRVKGA
jgi:hypothetical protein